MGIHCCLTPKWQQLELNAQSMVEEYSTFTGVNTMGAFLTSPVDSQQLPLLEFSFLFLHFLSSSPLFTGFGTCSWMLDGGADNQGHLCLVVHYNGSVAGIFLFVFQGHWSTGGSSGNRQSLAEGGRRRWYWPKLCLLFAGELGHVMQLLWSSVLTFRVG